MSDLAHLPFAVGFRRQTSGIIRQNVFVSLGIVAFLIPATIFGLGICPAQAVLRGLLGDGEDAEAQLVDFISGVGYR